MSNYLFIQKRRFRDALDYNLVETGSLADIQVPLMILQIHVENAIDHGIRRKINGNGSVSVTIADIGDYVLLNVIDDGIGRPSAAKYRSHGFRQGVRMLQELITIYNRQNQLPMSQEYEDEIFTDTDGVRYGTRVIIRIPKIYRYDL